MPAYDGGWLTGPGEAQPFLSYVADEPSPNWSEELEVLHEGASRRHFLDRWTRNAIVTRLGSLAPRGTLVDIGCSTGYLLEDVVAAFPTVHAFGVDLVASGLGKAHTRLPDVRLLQADACAIPIGDRSVDAVVSANLLEHVPNDVRVLQECARILKPAARAVIVVPASPDTYDYYDRFLGHERRYARRELAQKCVTAGLEVLEDGYIGGLVYPAFWLVKQRNRRRYGALAGDALRRRVSEDIRHTRDSRLGELSWGIENRAARAGLRLPFGIRSLVVVRKPRADW